MPLDAAQAQKLDTWQKETVINKNCLSCMHFDWTEGEIVAFQTFSAGDTAPSGEYVKVVQIVCKHCGHISQYLASTMGI